MIEVRDFRFSDINEIDLRPEDKKRIDDNNWIEIIGKSITYTLLYNDKVLCIGGICFYRKDFGEAWLLCSKDIDKHPVIIARLVKRTMENIIIGGRILRLQATVRCNGNLSKKFIEFLGFQKEGTLRKYGYDGSDYYMYSRVT